MSGKQNTFLLSQIKTMFKMSKYFTRVYDAASLLERKSETDSVWTSQSVGVTLILSSLL